MTATFATTILASGKMELVPETLAYLNPESEGSTQYLYFVWPFKADAPFTLKDTVGSQAKAPLYGYFTNHLDLYKAGRHDAAVEYAHFKELECEYLDLTKRVLDKIEPLIGKGEVWTYAFCVCDSMGGEVPVGVANGFEKVMSHE